MRERKKIARRFHAKAQVKLSPMQSGWKISVVTIFDENKAIGSYERNYAAFSEETFEPFELNGKWYALYSRDYTATRIMSLPGCVDLGGEDGQADGFCPAELYVPRFKSVSHTFKSGRKLETLEFEGEAEKYGTEGGNPDGTSWTASAWQSLEIGFVAGCLWGDDTSWKLQVFDLSRASEGKLARTERFGHLQLARGYSLVQALQLYRAPAAQIRVSILQQQTWDLATGALIDPYDQ